MMNTVRVEKIREYGVGLVGWDGEVIRWVTVKAMSRDSAIAQLDRKYMSDDTVFGYQFEEVR